MSHLYYSTYFDVSHYHNLMAPLSYPQCTLHCSSGPSVFSQLDPDKEQGFYNSTSGQFAVILTYQLYIAFQSSQHCLATLSASAWGRKCTVLYCTTNFFC